MSMIVAIEGLIPDRRAGSADKNPASPPLKPQIYASEWLREQQVETNGPQPNPALDLEDQEEKGLSGPQAEPAPGSAADASPDPGPIFNPGESTFASETQSPSQAAFAPDTRVPFSIDKNRFGNKNRFGRRGR